MRRSELLIVVLLLLPTPGWAATAGSQVAISPLVTPTRLQVLFLDLERQWSKAVQGKDQAALTHLLASEFEVWTPAPPGNPMSREKWLAHAFDRKSQSFRVQRIAVRSVSPQISVASFVLSEDLEQDGKLQTEEHFIVDVWINGGKGDEGWRCTDRYESDIIAAPHPAEPQPRVQANGKQ